MPKSPRVPSYRYHKASRQAVVVIRGKSYYLGPWNSPESQAEYRRVVAEHWAPDPGPTRGTGPAVASAPPLTVDEVMAAYWTRRVVPVLRQGRPADQRAGQHPPGPPLPPPPLRPHPGPRLRPAGAEGRPPGHDRGRAMPPADQQGRPPHPRDVPLGRRRGAVPGRGAGRH